MKKPKYRNKFKLTYSAWKIQLVKGHNRAEKQEQKFEKY